MIAYLYFMSGIFMVCMYLPQLKLLWKDQQGALSTSLIMWAGWSIANCITFIYAVTYNGDPTFQFVSLGNLVGCSSVFTLALIRRSTHLSYVKQEV